MASKFEPNYGKYKPHPAAQLFPLMVGKEFADLVEDIKQHGLNRPVMVKGDILLDGRNRIRAALQAKVMVKFEEWKGEDEDAILHYIVSENLHRRHLTAGQLANIALDLIPQFEEAARKRKEEGQQKGLEMIALNTSSGIKDTDKEDGRVVAKVAEMVGVAASTVQKAQVVAKENPELMDKVKTGEVKLGTAYKQVRPLPDPGYVSRKGEPMQRLTMEVPDKKASMEARVEAVWEFMAKLGVELKDLEES